MQRDYRLAAETVMAGMKEVGTSAPGVMKAFGELGAATYADGALDTKAKELIALAIGVASRCDGCVAYHAKAAHDRGATRQEVIETVSVAVHMGGGPSLVYGAEALKAYDQFAAG